MGKKRAKYYQKSPYKSQIEGALLAIQTAHTYRIRTGKVRIVFRMTTNTTSIIAINTRGDAY